MIGGTLLFFVAVWRGGRPDSFDRSFSLRPDGLRCTAKNVVRPG